MSETTSAYLNALKEISKYFESGNNISVEKATIKTSDFEKILKENGIELNDENTSI